MPSVYCLEEGILVSHFAREERVDPSSIGREYQARVKLNPDPHLLLVKIDGTNFISPEVFSDDLIDGMRDITRAAAIFVDDTYGYQRMQRVLAFNRFQAAVAPEPVQTFSAEPDALHWLRSFA